MMMTEAEILALAHRTCWKYRHSTDPHHSHTYKFNAMTMVDFVRMIEAAAREKCGADTARMDFLEQNDPGRFDDVSGPDVFAVMFRLVEPARGNLREAIDAAMSAESKI